MAYSRDKTGNIQDEFEASYSTKEYANAKKHKDTHTHTQINNGCLSKDHRNQLKEVSMTKARTIWAKTKVVLD